MITNLNTEKGWSPQQAIIEANEMADQMEHVIIAYYKKNENGEVYVMGSEMDTRDLLFLAKAIEFYAMGG